ncbi:hypothetical protein GC173_13170 [bacterium]|nr:hypothetical protein [bacterium]
MRILRPLSPALFGEFREVGDVCQVLRDELLVSTPRPCARALAEGDCVCARAFVGCRTGCATTLARVVEVEDARGFSEFVDSPAAGYWWGEDNVPAPVDHLMRVDCVLRQFSVGDVLRLRWSQEGACLYRARLLDAESLEADLCDDSDGDWQVFEGSDHT